MVMYSTVVGGHGCCSMREGILSWRVSVSRTPPERFLSWKRTRLLIHGIRYYLQCCNHAFVFSQTMPMLFLT